MHAVYRVPKSITPSIFGTFSCCITQRLIAIWGVKRGAAKTVRNGHEQPKPAHRAVLTRIAANYAREHASVPLSCEPLAACAAYLALTACIESEERIELFLRRRRPIILEKSSQA